MTFFDVIMFISVEEINPRPLFTWQRIKNKEWVSENVVSDTKNAKKRFNSPKNIQPSEATV